MTAEDLATDVVCMLEVIGAVLNAFRDIAASDGHLCSLTGAAIYLSRQAGAMANCLFDRMPRDPRVVAAEGGVQ